MEILGRFRVSGVALGAMLCVVVLTACGGEASGSNPNVNANKSNADLLKEASANMKAAKSFHIEADISYGKQSIPMNGDYDMVNSSYMETIGAGSDTLPIIYVGGKSYFSLDEGKTYQKSGGADSGFLTEEKGAYTNYILLWRKFEPGDVDKASTALKEGTPSTEKIDGADTRHIALNGKDLATLNAGGSYGTLDGMVDLWVSTDAKPYVRQMKVDGKSGDEVIKGTIKWSKFDENFDIKAPPISHNPISPVMAATGK